VFDIFVSIIFYFVVVYITAPDAGIFRALTFSMMLLNILKERILRILKEMF